MNILECSASNHCGAIETLGRMLVTCPTVRDFWLKVFTWWENNNNHSNYQVEGISILYGFNLKERTTVVLNYVILIAKWHIYIWKIDNNPPNFNMFLEILKDIILLNRKKAIIIVIKK